MNAGQRIFSKPLRPIKVLVIDDSFTMRLLISDILNADPEITVVDAVKSGIDAINKLPFLKPDCITLDLMMPDMDGLTALKKIMAKYPTPTVIVSAHSHSNADITFRCLANGAVSYVTKPSEDFYFNINDIKENLRAEVKAAATVKLTQVHNLLSKKLIRRNFSHTAAHKIILIGCSTGGPQTLMPLLSSLPADFPVPIVVAQHLPKELDFLHSLIERLNHSAWITIKVIEDGEIINSGTVYFVPSAHSVFTVEEGHQTVFRLQSNNNSVNSPCIDSIMHNFASLYQERTLGIILSGMGKDGVEGMRNIKKRGGSTIVEDESSLLFGMPKAVIDQQLADKILPIESIPLAIEEFIAR